MLEILKISYQAFNNDWDLLQEFLKRNGNPRYELIGDVDFYFERDIIDFGNLVRINGCLVLTRIPIKSLGNLKYVGGYLDLSGIPIQSLGNLEYVGDDLYLYNTSIQSLGKLIHVGGTICLSRDHQIPEKQLNKFNFRYL